MLPTPTLSTKPHYPILDGLRGVAALLVVAFHLFEAHATSHQDQLINHGYLAVDFFFLLSGFVIGYAYDDRWPKMTLGNFFQRRLVRLQPMVVMGMVVGGLLYYFQATPVLPLAGHAPVWQVLALVLLGSLMVPVPPSFDVRGWQETYPLNGPGWSLMFEYIANVLYAVIVRRFSRLALGVLVALSAAALLHLLLTRPEGDIVGGWSLEPLQLRIGFTRVMFPFFGGLLLFRMVRPSRVPHAFLLSSLLVVAVARLVGGFLVLGLVVFHPGVQVLLHKAGEFHVALEDAHAHHQVGVAAGQAVALQPEALLDGLAQRLRQASAVSHQAFAAQEAVGAVVPEAAPVAVVRLDSGVARGEATG